MQNIAIYREFNGKKTALSVIEGVSEKDVSDEILRYMKSFKADVICSTRVYDEVKKGNRFNIDILYRWRVFVGRKDN